MHATLPVLSHRESAGRSHGQDSVESTRFQVVDLMDEASARHPLPRKMLTVRDSRSALPRIVPVSLIRQIDRELKTGRWDPEIVSAACGGLQGGSSRFEQAYIAARLQDYTRQPAVFPDPLPHHPPVIVTVMPAFQTSSRHSPNPPDVTETILHGGHLMRHFGIWIVSLLTLQALSALQIGALTGRFLGAGGNLHSASWLCLMLAFNLRVWFLYYGQDSKSFHRPGICLFLVTILPVFLLYQLAVLKS